VGETSAIQEKVRCEGESAPGFFFVLMTS
jgi:hypothetical protein